MNYFGPTLKEDLVVRVIVAVTCYSGVLRTRPGRRRNVNQTKKYTIIDQGFFVFKKA